MSSAKPFALLELLQRVLELMMLDAEHDGRIHFDEAAVAVPGEALVAGIAGQRFDGLVVEAEIEHRVHHAGHGGAGARAHGDEQRPFRRRSKAWPATRPISAMRGVDLRVEVGGKGLAVGVEIGADLGGDGEAGRNGQAERGHFGQIGALAAEKLPHGRRPFGATAR